MERAPRCHGCAYDLRGIPAEVGACCPECGTTIDWALARLRRRRRDGWTQLGLMGGCFTVLCVAAVLATRRDAFNIFAIPISGVALSAASIVCIAIHYGGGRDARRGWVIAGWTAACLFLVPCVLLTALLLWERFAP